MGDGTSDAYWKDGDGAVDAVVQAMEGKCSNCEALRADLEAVAGREAKLRYLFGGLLEAWVDFCEDGQEDHAEAYAIDFAKRLRSGQDAEHRGDCTKEAFTCLRCWHDRVMGAVDEALARPGVVKVLEGKDG